MPDPARPGALRRAVRDEWVRVLHPPYESLIVVAVNGALMSSAWFLLPPSLKDQLFTLHGSLAFAVVLSGWMYADVPATNLLAPDAHRVASAINEPAALRRLLAAKNLVLWSVVTPICMAIAWVNGFRSHDLLAGLYSAIWIGVVPFGVLAISAWVGILFPYHPMPLRYRWDHRDRWWPMLGRWITLVILPYGLVPALSVLLMAPSLLLWGLTSPNVLTHKLPDHDLGLGVGVACAVALVAMAGGHRVSLHLMGRRSDKLLAFLADPTAG